MDSSSHGSSVQELDHILQGVSRSFYLSIRLLPLPMRQPIALAYLLARASDTIADELAIPSEDKVFYLLKLQDCIANENSDFHPSNRHLLNKPEQVLLEKLPSILQICFMLNDKVKSSIQTVLDHIISGQIYDIEKFEINHSSVSCEEELLDYCYKVAGCVGEFWTEIGFLTTPSFSHIDNQQLRILGKNLGIGLQLVNVLRDTPKDFIRGRSYLPNMKNLDKDILYPWIQKAELYLQDGFQYADAMYHRRNKVAVYLPTVLGMETLQLLAESSVSKWQEGIKISRLCVYKCLIEGLIR